MRDIDKIILHCSDSKFGSVELIDKWHKERKPPFDCIGYHYVIMNGCLTTAHKYDPSYDGLIGAGRDLGKAGAHCRGENKNSVGICFIGVDKFTDAQMDIAVVLVRALCEDNDIDYDHVYGHNEFNKGKTCPNFDVEEFRERLKCAA